MDELKSRKLVKDKITYISVLTQIRRINYEKTSNFR